MSGIGGSGPRGRGGISNVNRIAPKQRFVETFPVGVWALYNPYETGDPLNIYTPGGNYDQLGDLSGNGRHMIDDHAFDPADASAAIYPGKNGLTSLPVVNTLNYLRYLQPDTALGDVSWVQAGPWIEQDNSDKPWEIAYGTGAGVIFAMQWDQGDTPEKIELFNVLTTLFEYDVDIGDTPDDPAAWYVWVATSRVNGATVTWNFKLIVDRNDGNGAILEIDATDTETTSTANPGNGERRSEWRGVRCRGTGNQQAVGSFALWTRELTAEEVKQAAEFAAAQIGAAQRNAVRALLS